MIKKINSKFLFEKELLKKIEEDVNKLNTQKPYTLVLEYFNSSMLGSVDEIEMCEIKKDQLILKNRLRKYFDSKNIDIKKLYILGSKDNSLIDEFTLAVEETSDEEDTKDIIWPCKEIFFYDGGKKILDDMLDNDEIDIVEYENQIKILKYEFGLLEDFEDELYIN